MLIWYIIFSVLFAILLIMLINFIRKYKPQRMWSVLLLYTTILQLLVNIVGIFKYWRW